MLMRLEASPTLMLVPAGLAAVPVRFKAHGVVVAIALERAELTHPIDDAAAHRRPLKLAVRLANRVFAVAMADAVLGQEIVVVGVGHVAGEGR